MDSFALGVAFERKGERLARQRDGLKPRRADSDIFGEITQQPPSLQEQLDRVASVPLRA